MNKTINNLIQRINDAKLSEIDYEKIHERIKDPRKLTEKELNCYISEYITEHSLRREGFKFYNKEDIPRNGYEIKQDHYNLKFCKNTRPLFEIDFIGEYKNQRIIIETKSGSLKEYDSKKTEYLLQETKRIFNEPTNIIFFASFQTKQRFIEFKEKIKSNPQVRAINLKLTKDDYIEHRMNYYEYRDGPSTENELSDILRKIKSN
jgi:hypothetical protein